MKKSRFSITCFILLTVGLCGLAKSPDYYRILDVSRTATTAEVRSAYKRLAKEAHPDKSKDPDASSKFAEINEAYEVLSDPKKRREYDTFGTISNQNYMRFDPFEQFSSFFRPTEPSKNIVELDFANYQMEYLPKTNFRPLLVLVYADICYFCSRIYPLWNQLAEKYTSIGIVVAKANLQRETRFKDLLNVLEVPTMLVVVNHKISYYFESTLSQESMTSFIKTNILNANPSDTRTSTASLFSTRLASDLIFKLDPSQPLESFNDFHRGWLRDSRSRIIFSAPGKDVSLKFCIAAFKSANHLAAAYFDSEDSRFEPLLLKLRIQHRHYENAVIFKEHNEQPAAGIANSNIGMTKLEEFMWKYNRLAVPRITSAFRMANLCPLDGSAPVDKFDDVGEMHRGSGHHEKHRHVCLMLLMNTNYAKADMPIGKKWLSYLANVTATLESWLAGQHASNMHTETDPIITPVHIYTDKQRKWFTELHARAVFVHDEQASQGDLDKLHAYENIGRLVILWRANSRQTVFRILPREATFHPGKLLPLDSTNAQIDSFQVDSNRLANLQAVLLGQLADIFNQMQSIDLVKARVKPNANIQQMWLIAKVSDDLVHLLVDEFDAPLLIRIKKRIFDWLSFMHVKLGEFVQDPFNFTSSITMIILSMLILSATNLALTNTKDDKQQDKKKAKSKMPEPVKTMKKPAVVALNPETYASLVLCPACGIGQPSDAKLIVVLCIMDAVENQKLIDQFQFLMGRYGMVNTLAATVKLAHHAGWLAHLISVASGMPVRVFGQEKDDIEKENAIIMRPGNCLGTVLALNPRKHYFHLYHPTLPESQTRVPIEDLSEEEEEKQETEVSLEKGGSSKKMRDQHEPNDTGPRLRTKHLFGEALGLDSEDEYDEEEHAYTRPKYEAQTGPMFRSELLRHLPYWLDRLYEGQLKRIHIDKWPKSLIV